MEELRTIHVNNTIFNKGIFICYGTNFKVNTEYEITKSDKSNGTSERFGALKNNMIVT